VNGNQTQHGESLTTEQKISDEISEVIRNDWGHSGHYVLLERDLLALTALLDEHPEWWDHPCMCAECRSYTDG